MLSSVLEKLNPPRPPDVAAPEGGDPQPDIGDVEAQPITVHRWRQGLLSDESLETLPSDGGVPSELLKILIVAAVQQRLSQIAFYHDDLRSGLDKVNIIIKKNSDDEKKKVKVTLEVAAAGEIKMPFWGRVFDATHTPWTGKGAFMDLGGEDDLRLMLDGKNFMNPHKSSCCPAWFADVLVESAEAAEVQQEENKEATEPKEERQDGDIVPPAPEPKTKAKSKAKSKGASKGKGRGAPLKPPKVATFEVRWVPDEVTVGARTFAFQIPELVALSSAQPGDAVARAQTDLDKAPRASKQSAERAAHIFALA